MITNIVVLLAAGIVLAVCALLVFHKDYEDGLFGRLGLGLIGLASLARVLGIIEADFGARFSNIALVLWAGLALFLTRHAWRALWRKRRGENWRETDNVLTGGKR